MLVVLLECFPRHRAAASLKRIACAMAPLSAACFPRHRAAASLKPLILPAVEGLAPAFSAASGRGLIEARVVAGQVEPDGVGFPRHRAAASLKLAHRPRLLLPGAVFRGIGPRPH